MCTSLLTLRFPSKAFLALVMKTITVQKIIIDVFLQRLRIGIKPASSARWASFFFYYYCHYRETCTTSPYHTGECESLRVTGAKVFPILATAVLLRQLSTDPSQVQSTQNFSFSAVRDT